MRTVSSTTKPPAPAEDKAGPAEDKAKKNEPEDKPKKTDLEEGELEEAADEQQTDTPDGPAEGEKATKKRKTTKATKTVKTKKSKSDRKRGPARPYRKLPQETLESRIKKLEKRIERTSAQAEEGRTFLSKYTREQGFRDAEAVKAAA